MKKINNIKIGTNIQKIRKSFGYTQEKLAEEIECSTRYISDVEQNRSNPSYEVLVSICNLFKIGMDDIFVDYLDTKINDSVEFGLEGFKNLNKADKETIEHMISFFNKK